MSITGRYLPNLALGLFLYANYLQSSNHRETVRLGWMPACLHPELARGDDPFPVHSQATDCRSTCRRQADNLRAILTPPEVFLPGLSARVEQRDFLLVSGVNACLKILLEAVTAPTGQA